jgi:hypothetical protein
MLALSTLTGCSVEVSPLSLLFAVEEGCCMSDWICHPLKRAMPSSHDIAISHLIFEYLIDIPRSKFSI